MKKKRKLSTAKAAAWNALSKCVRYAHAHDGIHASCVTCGVTKPWDQLHAGHFYPKKKGAAVAFDPVNVAPQCPRCNLYESGNIHAYYAYMQKTHGQGAIDRLQDKCGMVMNWRVSDYEEMEMHYKSMFAWMQQQRAEGVTGQLELVAWA